MMDSRVKYYLSLVNRHGVERVIRALLEIIAAERAKLKADIEFPGPTKPA